MLNPDPENLAKRLREVGERALNLLIRCNDIVGREGTVHGVPQHAALLDRGRELRVKRFIEFLCRDTGGESAERKAEGCGCHREFLEIHHALLMDQGYPAWSF